MRFVPDGVSGSNILTLALAILAEVAATSALKASDSFTRLWPSLLTVAGYALAFYCMALTLREVPVGVVYAIWSGAGIVLIAAIGWAVFGERLDAAAIVGMALIVAGVLVINLMSEAVRR